MKIQIWPKTKSGRISVSFIVISIALILSVIIYSANLGKEIIAGGFFGNMPLALATLGAFACAAVSFISCIAAIFKHKERSILLFICLVICILFIYFGIAQIVGEITGTH